MHPSLRISDVSLARPVGALGLITLLLLWPQPAQAEPEDRPLALSDAVRMAVENYPSVRISRYSVDETREAFGEARSARLPSLKLNGSAIRYEEPMVVSPIHGFNPGEFPTFNETLIQGGLVLNYLVFDGGGRGGRIEGARSRLDAAGADLAGTRQALIARVAVIYLEALSGRQVLKAHDMRINALHSEASRVRQRLEAGRSPRVEVLRVEAALANAEADRVKTAEGLRRAERDLARIIGSREEAIRADRLVSLSLAEPSLPDEGALKRTALESSPALARARFRTKSAEAGLSVARSSRWPEVNLFGNYLYFGSDEGNGSSEWQAGLMFSYLIYNGGGRGLAVRRAEAAEQGAREGIRLAEILIEEEVDHALSRIEETRARVRSLVTAVARFEEVVRIEKLLVESGAGVEADYLDAEADLLAARAGLAEAQNGEMAARMDLARITGELEPAWIDRHLRETP